MPNPNDQIEQIVSEVLSRLGHARKAEASNPNDAKGDTELWLTDPVVTAAGLSGRLSGIQRIVVPARAVVTPSARDLLREKNISLVRALKSAADTSRKPVVLAAVGAKVNLDGISKQLGKQGIAVRLASPSDVSSAVAELVGAVQGNTGIGVLLTDHVAAAVCLANRNRGIRAASAANRGEVSDIIRSIGANLLAIDPARRSQQELIAMMQAFVGAASHQCPTNLKGLLD